MNKIKASLCVAALLGLTTSPAQAAESEIQKGAGEWDKVGTTETLLVYTNDFQQTQLVFSGGGNFQIRVSNAQAENTYRIWLYEVDGTYKDDWQLVDVSPKYGYGDVIHTWDVSNYVDGSDGQAEFVAHIGYGTIEEYVSVEFYD